MPIHYRQPRPELRPFVAGIWWFEEEIEHAYERILPSGKMQLLVNLHEDELRAYHGEGYRMIQRNRGAELGGAYASHFAIDTAEQRCIVGVSFGPGGAYPFFTPPADATRELHVELDALWGSDGAALRERLLEARTPEATLRTLESVLLEQRVRPLERDPAVDFAIRAFDRGAGVGEVTDRLGMSAKSFIRRFAARVGLTPKKYARVVRFQRVLDAVASGRPIDWAGVAIDCGYFDQAHLIHDFREFSGMNPLAYKSRPGEKNHVPL